MWSNSIWKYIFDWKNLTRFDTFFLIKLIDYCIFFFYKVSACMSIAFNYLKEVYWKKKKKIKFQTFETTNKQNKNKTLKTKPLCCRSRTKREKKKHFCYIVIIFEVHFTAHTKSTICAFEIDFLFSFDFSNKKTFWFERTEFWFILQFFFFVLFFYFGFIFDRVFS